MNNSTNQPPSLADADVESLLDALGKQYRRLQKDVALSSLVATLSPIEDAGQRIRTERKAQGLTLAQLSDLSGVAYVTLNKIENGHPSARLDSIVGAANALGLKLWIG